MIWHAHKHVIHRTSNIKMPYICIAQRRLKILLPVAIIFYNMLHMSEEPYTKYFKDQDIRTVF